MVKVNKDLTHIYHNHVYSEEVAIGADSGRSEINHELFEKSLALTSDLKRLPFLLGGKLTFTQGLKSQIMICSYYGL